MKRLAVIPSDPIKEYFKKGFSSNWLKDYYNPGHFFDEVYLLSDLEDAGQEESIGVKSVHTTGKTFAKTLKELKIDLVRAYGGNWACALACGHTVPGIPVVVSVHDPSPQRIYDPIKRADIVLCVSEEVKKAVAVKFKRPERTWLLSNRVDLENMRPYSTKETEHLDKTYPYRYKIVHVGRRSREKNLDTLIRALAILGNEYCVIAIGQGDTKVYQDLAQQEGVASRVFLIDSVPHEQLGHYFSFSDCFCTPSRWEGFGVVFIEALACEAMVVTSNIAPLNEYMVNNQNSLLVKEFEDPRVLAEAICKACTDNDLRKIIKKNARGSVKKFEKKAIEQQEADYYKKILGMNSKGEFENTLGQSLRQGIRGLLRQGRSN
jgi:glycosyltransferase involved in cell wall biosynthesis